jgi:hypothetical protein
MKTRALFPFLLAALAFGCTDGGEDEPEGGQEPDPVAGTYEVTSTYDVSSSEVLPELVGNAIGPLTGLSEDPAGTLIAILQASGSQTVDDLLDAIPSQLMDAFKNAVNDFIFDQIAAGGTGADIIQWTDDIAGMLTAFDVVTRLEVGRRNDSGVAGANHTLAAVAFNLRGERQLVDTPELINTLTVARDVECSISGPGDGDRISIGEHAFHLPLGDFAVIGFNQALEASFGAPNLQAALGQIIDCQALAAQVADICVFSLCVGHEAEIAGFCNEGLATLAAEVEERIASIDFAELRLAAGDAALLDAGKEDGIADGLIDVMDGGSWQTDVEIDGLVLPVPASFRAIRLGAGGAAE